MNSISGIDLPLDASGGFEPRMILDGVIDFWPSGIFQDANNSSTRLLREVLDDASELKTDEFFVYKDQSSADTWQRQGLSSALNTMLHFLIVEDLSRPGASRITMVIDELTSETMELYAALSSRMGQLRPNGVGGPRLGKRTNFDEVLRESGYSQTRMEFYDLLDELRRNLYPEWTEDELACHPHDAQQFCEIVRRKAGAPLPDSVIMKGMFNRRKRKPA